MRGRTRFPPKFTLICGGTGVLEGKRDELGWQNPSAIGERGKGAQGGVGVRVPSIFGGGSGPSPLRGQVLRAGPILPRRAGGGRRGSPQPHAAHPGGETGLGGDTEGWHVVEGGVTQPSPRPLLSPRSTATSTRRRASGWSWAGAPTGWSTPGAASAPKCASPSRRSPSGTAGGCPGTLLGLGGGDTFGTPVTPLCPRPPPPGQVLAALARGDRFAQAPAAQEHRALPGLRQPGRLHQDLHGGGARRWASPLGGHPRGFLGVGEGPVASAWVPCPPQGASRPCCAPSGVP